MIEKNEVLKMATELGLRPETIEKDYVLGWMLWAIHQHPAVARWAFKGGTSFKKCHFETFRFSEDLDFTLTDPSHLTTDFLSQTFNDITERLSEEVGIEFFRDRFTFKIKDKGQGRFSAQGKIHFNGPLRRRQSVASIKLDLTSDEVLVLETVTKGVHHPYSDEPDGGIRATCYAFEEVVAEKIRALAQRARPRDLYDVIHCYRNRQLIDNPRLVYGVLETKCDFKSIAVPTYQSIEQHEKLDELEPQWANMLAHQLPSLPPMESFWAELPDFFSWLAGLQPVETTKPLPAKAGETVFHPGRISSAFGIEPYLQRIQFAAANRICVALGYHGTVRTVEPLSFRHSKDDNRLFYGFEREAGHAKAYSLGKIESVEVTNQPYTARYPVEINASGPISMPHIRRR
ncbi:MAG: nucleotidyl transferase AbiEii/AbiGii toxin family protein [Gammaproteobacteria bacterium]|nr:nucleotidyl transferase AbiEii/AbiGii toxin family protein [Gammaproteobacteria bacterium]